MFHLFTKKRGNLKDDTLSGLTVAFALVPEAIAFSMIIKVNPLIGLWAAVFMGFITAAFGGRPGMISGATGAIAVVLVPIIDKGRELGLEHNIANLGEQFMYLTIILAGCMQVIIGLLKLGRFIRLVPHPVMMGFVNGLAIVIGKAQIASFKNKTGIDEQTGKVTDEWMVGSELGTMVGLVLLTMAIIHFLPKLTKAIPSSLAAILVVGLLGYFGVVDSKTVGDILTEAGGDGSLSGEFPGIANLSGLTEFGFWNCVRLVGVTAILVCLVGLIESLMTLQLIDELTETRGKGNRECLAQGSANFLSGLFGGMGGCAMIGQSLINIKSGGRGRTSGIVGALALMLFVMVAGGVIVKIPIAALTGVMFMVVIGTFEWATFKTFGKAPKSEIFIILLVTVVTVVADLAIAVIAGVIASALVFAWESSKHVTVTVLKDEEDERIYGLEGLLYFGSVREFSDKFQAKSDAKNVVIDFGEARVCDLSGLEAINALGERYRNAGKVLHVRHLSPDCQKMLENAGTLVDIEVLPDDPHYTVASLKKKS
ncbi:MAG: SulP family inorganic anion transporter [Akkermansiaceae bacterium]